MGCLWSMRQRPSPIRSGSTMCRRVLQILASRIGWFDVSNTACGIFGLIAGFAITAGVSLPGKEPSAKKRELIEALRLPEIRRAD
jgi:Na+(H+)/acetate symporter ActP